MSAPEANGTAVRPTSIQRQVMAWLLGALGVGAVVLVLAAYGLTLAEIDEVLDDGLKQTALLLADRDLASALPAGLAASAAPRSLSPSDTESKLVALARRPDGALLFSSQPEVELRLDPVAGASVQQANGIGWHVYTVVQSDRVVQVAQPTAVRRESAAEAASQLMLPLLVWVALIAALLVVALRRGMQPLRWASDTLAQRSAHSLAPLALQRVPIELVPLVQTLNDLLHRLSVAFEAQRHFVADAAHELRSPVTALQLQVQILERSADAAERALATAELSGGIARARHLIEQLLSLSRADAPDLPSREIVRLGDLARAVVVRWSAEAERRHIDLGADADHASVVEGDANQLGTLLSNLVDNALRYTQHDGVVDVVAGLHDGVPTLSVIDAGPGIPHDERARVFDRFYRSPQAWAGAEAGNGLGLAIVKAIAERHDAAVTLHDGRDGTGLEVRVAFPAPP